MISSDTPRWRVLVVEDDTTTAQIVELLLERFGHTVVRATGGCEALTALQQMPVLPDVILLDLAMPNMDGRTFRAVQQHHPVWRAIPVIVLTAAQRGANTALELKASGCVTKPFNPEELMQMLEQVLLPTSGNELTRG